MTRTPAPALTAEEARTVARFDAAQTPPEVVAAGAAVEAAQDMAYDSYCPRSGLPRRECVSCVAEVAAAAAIAALPPSPAEEAHGPGKCVSVEDANRVLAETRDAMTAAVRRAALASPAPAPQGERACNCGGGFGLLGRGCATWCSR